MNGWMENLLRASRDAAVLSLMIGLLLILCGRYLPAGWRHGRWLLVAARLLMPVLPESAVSMQRVLDAEESVMPVAYELPRGELPFLGTPVVFDEAFPGTVSQSPAIGVEIPEAGRESVRIGVWEVLFRIWISGVIAVVGLGAFFTLRFSRRLRRFSRNDPRQVEMKDISGRTRRGVGIWENAAG